MCMFDEYELATVFVEKMKTSRKERRCDECIRAIQKGERYMSIRGLQDGIWWTSQHCEHCAMVAAWLKEECGGYLTRGLEEDLEQHIGEGRQDEVRILRMLAGMRRQWKRFDGRGMMDVLKI